MVEGPVVGGENVGDGSARAPISQPAAERLEVLLVAFQQRGTDGDVGNVLVFSIDQAQIASEFRIDLLLGEDLNGIDIHVPRHQVAECVLVTTFVHEVAQEDNDSLAGILNSKALGGVGRVRASM